MPCYQQWEGHLRTCKPALRSVSINMRRNGPYEIAILFALIVLIALRIGCNLILKDYAILHGRKTLPSHTSLYHERFKGVI